MFDPGVAQLGEEWDKEIIQFYVDKFRRKEPIKAPWMVKEADGRLTVISGIEKVKAAEILGIKVAGYIIPASDLTPEQRQKLIEGLRRTMRLEFPPELRHPRRVDPQQN